LDGFHLLRDAKEEDLLLEQANIPLEEYTHILVLVRRMLKVD
jgi:hypothetical protein